MSAMPATTPLMPPPRLFLRRVLRYRAGRRRRTGLGRRRAVRSRTVVVVRVFVVFVVVVVAAVVVFVRRLLVSRVVAVFGVRALRGAAGLLAHDLISRVDSFTTFTVCWVLLTSHVLRVVIVSSRFVVIHNELVVVRFFRERLRLLSKKTSVQ